MNAFSTLSVETALAVRVARERYGSERSSTAAPRRCEMGGGVHVGPAFAFGPGLGSGVEGESADRSDMSLRAAALLLLTTLALAAGCDDEPETPSVIEAPEPPRAAIDIDDPSACASCHATVVEEWRTSMHAHAHHDEDPLYGAMRRFRMEREGPELASGCAQCHGPRDPSNPDSPAARVGVGCAACHGLASVDRGEGSRMGARALTYSQSGAMRGPHDVPASAPAPHGVGDAAPWITDGRTLCLVCHDAVSNPQGVATCTTGAEHAQAGADQSCTSCHMPQVEGASGAVSSRATHRSHAFMGPHHLWREGEQGTAFMASAVSATPSLTGTSLAVTLRNRTQHAMPSGFPGRMVVVRAIGFDEAGAEVWRSFREDPMTEDPDAVLNKVYVDAEGAPTMPPYATEIARDNRLRPDEARQLTWTVPSSVTRAEIQLIFRLLPPSAARALGLSEDPVAQPRPLLAVTVTR
ncbi:MAG: hypothetical protein EVA89_02970 [Sandaracinaceae bacterium]|nr:MAG: hypothetical protein EVA89_02970 [Sandaracinaceae bacterium]